MAFRSILSGIRSGIKNEIFLTAVGTTTPRYTKNPINNNALTRSFKRGRKPLTIGHTIKIIMGITSKITFNIIPPSDIVGSLTLFSIGRILFIKITKLAIIITV